MSAGVSVRGWHVNTQWGWHMLGGGHLIKACAEVEPLSAPTTLAKLRCQFIAACDLENFRNPQFGQSRIGGCHDCPGADPELRWLEKVSELQTSGWET